MEKSRLISKLGNLYSTKLYYPISLFIFGSIPLLYKLSNVPKGLSSNELLTRNDLINHTYNLNYLLHHLSTFLFSSYLVVLNYLNYHSLILIRLSGYAVGLIAIFLFSYIARTFTNKFIGTITTILFATSLWFLQIIRNNHNLQYYSFAILLGIFISILYYRKKSINFIVILSSILLGLSFYVPGMIWFALLFIIINFKAIRLEIHSLSRKYKLISLAILLLILTPIVYESVHSHNLIYSALFIPSSINLHHLLTQFINYPKMLFVQNNPVLSSSIGKLPFINFASAIILIFSSIWLYKNKTNTLTEYIYFSFILDWVLCTLNGDRSIYIILPLLSLLVSVGLFYLYGEWKRIFPKNPYPNFLANLLLGLLVASIGLYQILLYFIVWPHTPQVLSLYSHYL